MSTMKQIVFSDFDRELATTRRMLSRVPAEHFDWQPHEKSMTLGALSAHMVNLLNWQLVTLEDDHIDFAASAPRVPIPTNTEELLASFDAYATKVNEALAATDDVALEETWTLRNGERVMFQMPKRAVFRMGISHIVHHRGQLSVYLRLLDVPVPPSYGPTADERGF